MFIIKSHSLFLPIPFEVHSFGEGEIILRNSFAIF